MVLGIREMLNDKVRGNKSYESNNAKNREITCPVTPESIFGLKRVEKKIDNTDIPGK